MDSEYLKQQVGEALVYGLSEICQKKPSDPIDYLSNWLLKYVENLDYKKQLAKDREQLAKEQAVAEEEKNRLKAMEEEQNRIAQELSKQEMENVSIQPELESIQVSVDVVETPAEDTSPEIQIDITNDIPDAETSENVSPSSSEIPKTEVINDTIMEEPEQDEGEAGDVVTDSLETS